MIRPSQITDRGELRKVARDILDEQISPSTEAEYLRIEKRLNGKHWHEYATENQLKNVAPIRAAWRRSMAKKVLIELSKSDDQELTGVERAAARATAAEHVEQLAEAIDYLRPAKPKSSKRNGQSTLPSDWRNKLLMAMPGKYKSQFMVMALTGARPEEIRRGVTIHALENGVLEFNIQGAKCSQVTGGGQDWRRLIVDPSVCLPLFGPALHDEVSRIGGEATLPVSTGLGLQKAITRTALEKLGLPKISAYSLRHAFASDLKRSKTDTDAISLAMGHVSRRSKQLYGRSKVGKSGKSPLVCVEAAKALTGEERIPPWLSHELSKKKGFDNKS